MPERPSPPPDARRPRPPARRPMPLARRPLPRAPCPTLHTMTDAYLSFPPPPTARRLRACLHTRTPSDTATRVILARGAWHELATIRPARQAPLRTPPRTPAPGSCMPRSPTSTCSTSICATAGVPLFKADRGAPNGCYRSTDLWSLWRRLLQRSGLPTPRKGLVTQARRGFSAP